MTPVTFAHFIDDSKQQRKINGQGTTKIWQTGSGIVAPTLPSQSIAAASAGQRK
jgi:hypothetical protein